MSDPDNEPSQLGDLPTQDRIDMVCDAFESAWQQGRHPDLEHFLQNAAVADSKNLLIELLLLEWNYLSQSGQTLHLEEYLTRFPESAKRIKSLFEEFKSSSGRYVSVVTLDTQKTSAAAGNTAGIGSQPTADQTSEQRITTLLPGDRLGGYELLELIGKGGMGVVFKARQLNLQRVVALKMIKPGEFDDPSYIRRFQAEATAAAQLDHPGIVQVYDVGSDAGRHYFSMAFIEGENLSQLVSERPLGNRRAAELTCQIAKAMASAHEVGLIHRDLKPANVLIDEHGQTKITDFGLAKSIRAESDLTATGQILGTPSYMPPEQATGTLADVTETADIYSIGAILYHLLTGTPPFQSANPFDTLKQVQEQDPVPLRKLDPQISPDLETICLKCLEKDPARRYRSANELSDDLSRYLRGEPILARPVGITGRAWRWCKRQPVVATLIAAVTLSLFMGAGFSTYYAVVANAQAEEAKDNARQANANERRSRQLLSNAYLSRGWRAYEEGYHPTALIWHAEAFRTVADMPGYDEHADELEPIHRLRITESLKRSLPIVRKQRLEGQIRTLEFNKAGDLLFAGSTGGLLGVYRTQTLEPVYEPIRHGANLSAFVISPDETKLATVGERFARIWDLKTGKPLTENLPHRDSVSAVVFSPDSKHLFTATGVTIYQWNAATGEQIGDILQQVNEPNIPGAIFRLALSSDGKTLISASHFDVTKWDLEKREQTLRFTTLDHLRSFTLTKDQRFALTTGAGASARIWDLTEGKPTEIHVKGVFRNFGMLDGDLSPDESQLAISNTGANKVEIRSTKTGQSVTPDLKHPHLVRTLSYSPDGTRLVTACEDGVARIWDTTTGELLAAEFSHDASLQNAKLTPDQTALVSGTQDGQITLWTMLYDPGYTRASPLSDPKLDDDAALHSFTVKFDNHGEKILVFHEFSEQFMIDVISPHTGKPICPPLRAPIEVREGFRSGKFVRDVQIDPSSRWVAMYLSEQDFLRHINGVIYVWDLTQPAKEPVLLKSPNESHIRFLTFSATGEELVVGLTDGSFHFYGLPGGEPTRDFKPFDQYSDLLVDSRGEYLVAGLSHQWRVFDAGTLKPLAEAEPCIVAPTLSGDGTRLAALQKEGDIDIWELDEEPKQVTSFTVPAGLRIGAMNYDGNLVATTKNGTNVRVWDIDSGAAMTRNLLHEEYLSEIKFSRDDRMLLTTTRNGVASMFELKTAHLIVPPRRHPRVFGDQQQRGFAAFSNDGRFLATVNGNPVLAIWESEPLDWPTDDLLQLAELSSGNTIDHTGALIPLNAARQVEIAQHLHAEHEEYFAYKGRLPYEALRDNTSAVKLGETPIDPANMLTEQQPAEPPKPEVPAGPLKVVKLEVPEVVAQPIESASLKMIHAMKGHSQWCYNPVFSPDGKTLATRGQHFEVRLWNVESGEQAQELLYPSLLMGGHAFSPSGETLAVCGSPRKLFTVDVTTGKRIQTLEEITREQFDAISPPPLTKCVAYSPSGDLLLTGNNTEQIQLWDTATGNKLRESVAHDADIWTIGFSPDATRFISSSWDGTAKLWDVATGDLIRTINDPSSVVYSAIFSKDGKSIYTAGGSTRIVQWNAETGEQIREFTGHESSIHSLSISADGSILASCSTIDNTVRLWSPLSGNQIGILNDPGIKVGSAAFSPVAPRTLATTGNDSIVRIWEVVVPE